MILPLSTGRVLVASGDTAILSIRPQLPCRVRRFYFPDNIAPAFGVLDIRIGKFSYFAAGGEIPAALWSSQSWNPPELNLPDLAPGDELTIMVRNNSAPATCISGAAEIEERASHEPGLSKREIELIRAVILGAAEASR